MLAVKSHFCKWPCFALVVRIPSGKIILFLCLVQQKVLLVTEGSLIIALNTSTKTHLPDHLFCFLKCLGTRLGLNRHIGSIILPYNSLLELATGSSIQLSGQVAFPVGTQYGL